MNPFFIIGLPRSRTAWLANAMTYGSCFCFHEAIRVAKSVEELPALFESAGTEIAGTADSGALHYFAEAKRLFPEAAFVLVKRSAPQALAALQRFAAEIPRELRPSADSIEKSHADSVKRFNSLWNSTLPALRLHYDELDTERAGQALWEHCTGAEPFHAARWKMLSQMRVTVIPGKVISAATDGILQFLRQSQRSGREQQLHEQFNAILAELCAPAPGAYCWLQQLWEVALTWDHLVDGDPLDTAMAERTFEALCFHWPNNPFFQAHKDKLIAVMLNAVAAWRHGNETGETAKMFDLYVEIPTTVAAIIGGTVYVNKYSPALRHLVDAIRGEHHPEAMV